MTDKPKNEAYVYDQTNTVSYIIQRGEERIIVEHDEYHGGPNCAALFRVSRQIAQQALEVAFLTDEKAQQKFIPAEKEFLRGFSQEEQAKVLNGIG